MIHYDLLDSLLYERQDAKIANFQSKILIWNQTNKILKLDVY
jgi:hypothetical protein